MKIASFAALMVASAQAAAILQYSSGYGGSAPSSYRNQTPKSYAAPTGYRSPAPKSSAAPTGYRSPAPKSYAAPASYTAPKSYGS